MSYILIIIIIIVCVLLGLIILIQNPKGGGLSSGFAGSNNIIGVQRTGDFLEKGTWGLVISLMVLTLLINVIIPKGGESNNQNDAIQQQINKPVVPRSAPATPSSLPGLKDSTAK
ncbi:MAG TPA: preprotein translocase subunit SecG [Sphingobacteriaceae bacterium]|nr:preprotein translocase subunit SecG [Sphingobacteriaceae bacterium]